MTEPEAAPAIAEEQPAVQTTSEPKFGNQSRYQANTETETQTDGSEEEPAPDPDGDFAAGRYTRYESSEEFLAALRART